jgi:hypothetical protein
LQDFATHSVYRILGADCFPHCFECRREIVLNALAKTQGQFKQLLLRAGARDFRKLFNSFDLDVVAAFLLDGER